MFPSRFPPPYPSHPTNFSTPRKAGPRYPFRQQFTPIRVNNYRPRFHQNFRPRFSIQQKRHHSFTREEIPKKQVKTANDFSETKTIASLVSSDLRKIEEEKTKAEQERKIKNITILFGFWDEILKDAEEGRNLKKHAGFNDLLMVPYNEHTVKNLNLSAEYKVENILVFFSDFDGLKNCQNPFL